MRGLAFTLKKTGQEACPTVGQASWPVFFLLASIATAAVDGTVTNRTTGKPQPGATVTLYKLGQNGLESVESVKTAFPFLLSFGRIEVIPFVWQIVCS